MSVIVGVFKPGSERPEYADVRRMLGRLRHCGPDRIGIWCDQHVGLGHGMLHTTPESLGENLPLYDAPIALAITCDARIDNRRELIDACGTSGRPESEIADSELILAAYKRWGERCVEKLLGDFAFAIWDGRKRQLFCARDPLGIKPFFYHYSSERFVFATGIKALFAIPEVPRSLNEARIGDHLAGFFEDRASTFFDAVFRLPPAHTVMVRPNGLTIRQYWKPDPSAENRRSSDAEYAEEFRALFTEAVRCRLRSAFPVGSMLSGGLDSSSIACVARNQMQGNGQGGRVHTFSAMFDSFKETDERFYISTVLRGGGFVPHFFDGDHASPLTELDTVLGDLDEVFHGTDVTFPRVFYASAREQGVRVMLDGLGGDEVVSHGSRYPGELLRNQSWLEFGEQVSGLARNFNCNRSPLALEYLRPYLLELKDGGKWLTLGKALVKIPREMNDPVPRFIWDYAFRPLGRTLQRRLLPRARGVRPPAKRSIVNDDFAKCVSLEERHGRLRNSRPNRGTTERDAHFQRISSGSLWMAIEEFGRAAAPFHLEPRYPLLDKRLVEFCLSLPSSQKLSQGWSRAVFRRAMDNILPEEVRWRGGKARFFTPFEQTLRTYGREFLDETILNTPPNLAHYFNMPVLRERYRNFLAGEASETIPIWRASTLIWWLRKSTLLPSVDEEAQIREAGI